jgi:hypothetical protein
MAEPSDVERDLKLLEAELRRLEAEYNMYFAGRLPRPPIETRRRVTALVRQLDRQRLSNYAERFRFTTLQTRFQTFVDLWDRGMRARDEGRPGPFPARPTASAAPGTSQEPRKKSD